MAHAERIIYVEAKADHWANHVDWKEEQEVRERWWRENVAEDGSYAAHKPFDE